MQESNAERRRASGPQTTRCGGSARHGVRCALVIVGLFATLVASTAPAAQRVAITQRVEGYPIIIEHMPGHARVAAEVERICREWLPELSNELGLGRVGAFRVVLVADAGDLRRSNSIRLPDWGVAFALMEQQVMVVDVGKATSAWNQLEEVIPHELSHLLLAQRAPGVRMPVWFVEGLAQWQAHEGSLIESWRLMESVWVGRAPSLGRIRATLPADESQARDAYRIAYAAFTARFNGDWARLPQFLALVAERGDFAEGFSAFWGEAEAAYAARFDAELHRKYKTRLLLFQTGPLFSVIAVLFLFVFLRIKLRDRRRLRRLEKIDRGLGPPDDGW